jgi:AraC-like DNA-binding protein
MLAEAARQTRCPHFGLLVGREWHLGDLGLLGELMRLSDTLGDALRLGAIHQRLNSKGAAAFVLEYAGSVSIGYSAFHPNAERMSPVYDLVIGLYVTCIRELCGPAWNPTEVLLPRSAPHDEVPYRQHFRCRVKFEADRAVIKFPAATMNRTLPGADPVRRAALEREAWRRADPEFLPQLYRSLRLLLLDGTTSGDRLAQQLDMHRRTLNRRLKAQRRTFQSVLDEVRFEVARHLLRETRQSVVDITHTLGYADASAFIRAFRRWTGVAPAQWRAQNGQSGTDGAIVQN